MFPGLMAINYISKEKFNMVKIESNVMLGYKLTIKNNGLSHLSGWLPVSMVTTNVYAHACFNLRSPLCEFVS